MANSLTPAFGQRVRTVRTKKRISQEELADRCGVHRTYMGSIERGETHITLTNIHKVARGFGMADWRDAGNHRKEFYSNLPPRNYRFHVMACNVSGMWNEAVL